MKNIRSLAAYVGKVLCLVVFAGVAQACGLSAFAAMSEAFIARLGTAPGEQRAIEAKIALTADATSRTLP